MLTRIEAWHYRCLERIQQPLGQFHVLVGPNASGKTTFLDVVAFLGDLVAMGPEAAVRERTQNFQDLLFARQGDGFELAVEARIPKELQSAGFELIRYEVAIRLDPSTGEIGIGSESVRLKHDEPLEPRQRLLFPENPVSSTPILDSGRSTQETQIVVSKNSSPGEDSFYVESRRPEEEDKPWNHTIFQLGPRRSSLGNLPDDQSRFPASIWLKRLLSDGTEQIVLDSLQMRRASPPGQTRAFKTDGSNLPWVVESLRSQSPPRFQEWIDHLRTALPDLETVSTVERPDDRHRYLMFRYRGGLEVPSWTASDGTLRLLALTLFAYLPDLQGVYLIEEPENGIHPRAVESVYQSLSNVYGSQLLLATHSPVILSLVVPDQLLCFAKGPSGATDVVVGSEHPALRDWQQETDLATLFAAGVLG
jgi:hypothetical protein